MHGFTQRSEVGAVFEWIDEHATRLDGESISLDEAAGRTLVTEVIAPMNVPGFDRAAMDGYALRGAETAGASEYNPLSFPVLGQAMPGQPFAGHIPPNAAVRIMTGAPVPEGVDAVVPAEYATESAGQIVITRPVAPGQHVGHCGEDIREGSVALSAGRRLRAQDVGLVASLGLDQLTVVRRPRVRILVTGNEVKMPGLPKSQYQVYVANSYMLRGLVARDGGLLEAPYRLGDDPDKIRDALLVPGADVILVSGGSSVGREDYAPQLIAELGELAIHGVAMRPSSPAGVGRIGETLVFLLPGNPVSSYVCGFLFLVPLIRALSGLASIHHVRETALLGRDLAANDQREDYLRARLEVREDGALIAMPVNQQDSSLLGNLAAARALLIRPPFAPAAAKGASIELLRLPE